MQGIREVVWTSQRARGKVQSRLSIFYPLVVYSAFSGMFLFLFSLFVLKFWAAELTLGLFFSHDFEGSSAERRPLIFLPKELFTPSADVSLAEAQVSSRSQQYSSNEINRMLWLERWKTHTHTHPTLMFYECEMISRQCPLIEFALILK